MKKLKYLIAALLLTACLIGSASAVTPTLKPPKIEIPKISVSVPEIKFAPGYFDNLLKNIDWSKINIR